jgi:hypothetical protein
MSTGLSSVLSSGFSSGLPYGFSSGLLNVLSSGCHLGYIWIGCLGCYRKLSSGLSSKIVVSWCCYLGCHLSFHLVLSLEMTHDFIFINRKLCSLQFGTRVT